MKRKIVQIAVMPGSEKYLPALFALADDGTVWAGNTSKGEFQWKRQYPQLPDDNANLTKVRNG